MRVINERHQTITEYDLTKGRLVPIAAVREDATPIDNVTKFAWTDEDWEEVQMFIPNRVLSIPDQIDVLKQKLRDTDYHIIKVMEGVSTLADCVEIMKQRAAWRKEINELEKKVI